MTTIVIPLSKSSDDWRSIHSNLANYLHGKCYPFAVMLHENLGWPAIGIINGDTIEHAGIQTPDGRIFDARGFVTEDEFPGPFKLDPGWRIELIEIDQIDLRKIKPSLARDVEEDMGFAERISRRLWPELPWENNLVTRAQGFASELEELSKKYGLYISSPFRTSPPMLFEIDGDEGGYTIEQLPLGNLSINRRLGI